MIQESSIMTVCLSWNHPLSLHTIRCLYKKHMHLSSHLSNSVFQALFFTLSFLPNIVLILSDLFFFVPFLFVQYS